MGHDPCFACFRNFISHLTSCTRVHMYISTAITDVLQGLIWHGTAKCAQPSFGSNSKSSNCFGFKTLCCFQKSDFIHQEADQADSSIKSERSFNRLSGDLVISLSFPDLLIDEGKDSGPAPVSKRSKKQK